jgi:hypothetical protein
MTSVNIYMSGHILGILGSSVVDSICQQYLGQDYAYVYNSDVEISMFGFIDECRIE